MNTVKSKMKSRNNFVERGEAPKKAPQGIGKIFREVGEGIVKGGDRVEGKRDMYVGHHHVPHFHRDLKFRTGDKPSPNSLERGQSTLQFDSDGNLEGAERQTSVVDRFEIGCQKVMKKASHLPNSVKDNPWGVFGPNPEKEMKKERAPGKYATPDGFGDLVLSCLDRPPPGTKSMVIYLTSTCTGPLVKEPTGLPGGGWGLNCTVPDRVYDVSIVWKDKLGDEAWMAGFSLPAIDSGTQTLDLPIYKPFEKSKAVHAKFAGKLTLQYSIKYNRNKEFKQLCSGQCNTTRLFIEPPTGWDDVGLAGEALAQRMMYFVEADTIINGVERMMLLFWWDNWKLTFVALLTSVTGIALVGYYECWLQGALGLLFVLLLLGRRGRQRYSEMARRQSAASVKKWSSQNPELIKMAVSMLYFAVNGMSLLAELFTWDAPKMSMIFTAGLFVVFICSWFIPFWVFLCIGTVIIFCVPGPMMKWPVLSAYIWPSHLMAIWHRQKLPRPYLGKLRVTIHTAHGLRVSDFIKNDPYVVVLVGEQTKRTQAIMNTRDPVWNETLEFIVYSPNMQVQLWMWDWDKSSGDDFMGEAHFETGGASGQKDLWLNVTQRSCMPLDFHLFLGGRVKISWSLTEIPPSAMH